MANILICDDERDIVSALKIYLSSEGHTLFEAYTGREALETVRKNDIHLVLMDIMMPEMDGVTATAKLREEYNIPIILLTAKSEDTDKVLGLNVGADDYITKPFNPIEVLARVRSQLRRYTTLGGMEHRPSKLVIGGIVLDDDAKTVTVDGEGVRECGGRSWGREESGSQRRTPRCAAGFLRLSGMIMAAISPEIWSCFMIWSCT